MPTAACRSSDSFAPTSTATARTRSSCCSTPPPLVRSGHQDEGSASTLEMQSSGEPSERLCHAARNFRGRRMPPLARRFRPGRRRLPPTWRAVSADVAPPRRRPCEFRTSARRGAADIATLSAPRDRRLRRLRGRRVLPAAAAAAAARSASAAGTASSPPLLPPPPPPPPSPPLRRPFRHRRRRIPLRPFPTFRRPCRR